MNLRKLRKLRTTRKQLTALFFAALLAVASSLSAQPDHAQAAPVVSTDWMMNGGYGVTVHWTSQSVPAAGGSPAAYCTAVNNFDANAFANQLADAGASYVIFTISHAQQYFPFPSAKLDSVISGRTCTRDLPSDIYNAIAPKGIKMVFYYPSIATPDDPAWITASQWSSNPASFAQLQYDLVTEIGNRYGSKLAGWWVDNTMGGYASKYNFSTYATALRAGYSDRAISFNLSSIGPWGSSTAAGIEDFAGGESNDMTRLPSGRYSGEGSTQWHTWTYLDDFWVHGSAGTPTPRYPDNKVILYAKSIMSRQGVLSLNAAPYQDNLISTPTMNQLIALKNAIRNAPGSTEVVDDRDAGISYSGAWTQNAYANDHLETSTFSTAGGSYAQYAFTGTAVHWYGPKGSDHGKADVYIDGVFQQTVDLYSASRQDVADIYSKTGLSDASHTLKVVVRSDRNVSSTGNYVEVDALEYQTGTRIDDRSGSVAYSGSWAQTTGSQYVQGTGTFTTASGSYSQYTFNGTKIKWYGVRGADHGKADVYIDGVFQQTVDLYQTNWTASTLLYSATGLSSGSHTIKVVARSDKNAASSGYYVEVDAFEQ